MPQSAQQRLLGVLRQPLWGWPNASLWRLSPWWPSDSREAMQHSLLRLLAVAQRENLDPSRLVGNLAEEHRGRYRRLLRRLSRRLSEGTPLVSALEQTPDVLSDRDVLAIRFASQTGTLGNTYEQLLRRHTAESEPRHAALSQYLLYPAVVLVVSCLILSFLAIYILPVFERIYSDFGLATPRGFRSLCVFVRAVSDYAPLFAFGAILLLGMFFSTTCRRFLRRVVATRSSKNAAQARTGELLRMLAMASEAGRPIPASLSTLARYHSDPQVRNKLLFVRNEVEQGANIWSSLASANLLTQQESDAFANLSCNESRVWAMRRLADERAEQVALKYRRFAAVIEPALILVLASMVLWVGAAIFGSLSNLTYSLS
jgi:type II secretory pathway component PulF